VLTAIKRWLKDRHDRQELLSLRAMMVDIHALLFRENEVTGQLVRMKTGSRLRQLLENRLGVMGPDFLTGVDSDYELDHEGKLLDRLPPERLAELATELGRLAERILLERGNPETGDDSGESTKTVAAAIALSLLSGWLKSKAVVHTSINRAVIKEAQELEDLYFRDIQRLLRLFRGEKAIKEGDA
jgi:hypothetical protein